MWKPISSIVLGVLGVLAPAVAVAQPGQTPVIPEGGAPPPAESRPADDGQPMPADLPGPQAPPNATRATFVSTGEQRWDIRVDGEAACSTPCSLVIPPLRFVALYSQERAPTRLAAGYLPPGDVLVQAKPRANGAFATGVTFTTLSGMGLVTGIVLTSVGCSTDRDGMCKAGLITGGASALGLYLSIDLLRRSLPQLYVGPAQVAPYAGGRAVGLAGRF
jgi:hypothetical protein